MMFGGASWEAREGWLTIGLYSMPKNHWVKLSNFSHCGTFAYQEGENS